MSEIIKVGMADLKTCVSPDGVTTLGLGSCVGIAIRDPVTKIGGLAHIMLPDSTTIRNSSQNIAKFADTGIDELVRQKAAALPLPLLPTKLGKSFLPPLSFPISTKHPVQVMKMP
jgi:chemotaxis receptor (MCP) glutamine deamidase CheD